MADTPPGPGHRLDGFDLQILRILEREGRISKTALAEAINLSATPTWTRVRRLETLGIIRGYHAQVDWSAVVEFQRILVEVSLGRHTAAVMSRFEERIATLPEVELCYATSGPLDYIMQVKAPNIDEYQRLMERLLAEDLQIERYYTYVVTKMIKPSSCRS